MKNEPKTPLQLRAESLIGSKDEIATATAQTEQYNKIPGIEEELERNEVKYILNIE